MSRHRGKILGGLIGLFVGGPFGALVGFWIGYSFDKKRGRRSLASRYAGRSEAVIAAVTALGAKIAKADGRVSPGEIRAFREAFNIRESDVPRMAALWREAARTPAGYEPYARHLQQIFADDPQMLRRILAGLRRVMQADVRVRGDEHWALEDIARIFGVEPSHSDDRDAGIDLDLRGVEADSMQQAFRRIFNNDTAAADMQVFANDGEGGGRSLSGFVGWIARPFVRDLIGFGVFISIYIACMVTGVFDGHFRYSDIVLSMAAGAFGVMITRRFLPTVSSLERRLEKAAKEARVSSGEVADTIEQTRAKVAEIRSAAIGLDSGSRQSIERICALASDIADSLIKDPGDVARSRPFLMHYLGSTHDVVRRFAELRARPVAGARFDPVFEKLQPLLDDLETLFRKHFERGLQDEALELDVSIDSLQRMVRSEQL